VVPGRSSEAFLQPKLYSHCASTVEPQWHWCGTQRDKPSHRPTPDSHCLVI